MGYDIVQTEAVSEFRDVFVALRTGLPLVFGELLFEQKCTVVVATPNLVAAKNDFPRSHSHHVQYYVTDYIPAAQTYVNTFPRPSLLQSGSGNEIRLITTTKSLNTSKRHSNNDNSENIVHGVPEAVLFARISSYLWP